MGFILVAPSAISRIGGDVVKKRAQIILKNSASLLHVFRNDLRSLLNFWILGFNRMKGLSVDQQHDLFQHFCRSLKTIVQLSLQPRLIFCWLFLVQRQFLLFSSVLLAAPVSQLVTVLQAALPPTEQQEEKSGLCRARIYSGHRTDFS